MNARLPIVALGALAFLVILAISTLFQVNEMQRALVLRFGKPIEGRGLIDKPGLHVKAPFMDSVVYIDKRILDLESARQEVLDVNNQPIDVDAFIRFKIVDPLLYYQSAGTLQSLRNLLSSNLNSSLRRVLGEARQSQIVRDDRSALMGRIREQTDRESRGYGVEVVDARIRRADLPRVNSESVFSRMQSERKREAAEYRAQGEEISQTIRAKANRDVTVLRAEAQQKGDQIRGEGEAERNRIFADVANRDPDFFAFQRSMQAYEATFKGGRTKFVVSPGSSDFFRFLGDPSGGAKASAR